VRLRLWRAIPLKEIPMKLGMRTLEFGGWAVTRNGDDNSTTTVVAVANNLEHIALVAKGRFGDGAERYRLLGYDDFLGHAEFDIIPISKLAIDKYGDTYPNGAAGFPFLFGVVTTAAEQPSTPMTVDDELVLYNDLVSRIPHEGRWL
jgi:hypothetical protein